MDVNVWLNVIFRWVHVLAGVMWIGHLYFFNFVNSHVAKTFDPESKKKVVPELMPRALYWFRWGAAWTWITGFLLLGIVYYMGGTLLDPESTMSVGRGTIIGIVVMVLGFIVYDVLWKTPLKNNPFAGTAVSVLLLAGVAWWLGCIFSGRAMFIHIGAILGTSMAANVWMRIWPAQRKIIHGAKTGEAVDPSLGPLAAMRSKHNTYMSVPLLFIMISNHYPTMYGSGSAWLCAIGVVIVGFVVTFLLYKKSASPVTAKY